MCGIYRGKVKSETSILSCVHNLYSTLKAFSVYIELNYKQVANACISV